MERNLVCYISQQKVTPKIVEDRLIKVNKETQPTYQSPHHNPCDCWQNKSQCYNGPGLFQTLPHSIPGFQAVFGFAHNENNSRRIENSNIFVLTSVSCPIDGMDRRNNEFIGQQLTQALRFLFYSLLKNNLVPFWPRATYTESSM